MKKLSELLKGIQIKNFYGRLDREVNSLVIDSREAGEGSVFFAIKGRRFNGHDFILDAYKKGCRVFIVEREISGLKDSTLIITDNSRMAFSIASSNFYNNPSGKLNVYGITGSTGKTTLIHLLRELIPDSASLGSEGKFIKKNLINRGEGLLTTPETFEIQKFLDRCLREKVKDVFLEVSSFALMNYRVEGINFKGGIFLNLHPTHHLMIHKTILNYLKSKIHLLELTKGPFILNLDDPYHSFFKEKGKENLFFYSKRTKTHFFVEEKKVLDDGFLFKLNLMGEKIDVKLNKRGDIDIVLPALSFLKIFYNDTTSFVEKIKDIKRPPGRWEILSKNPLIVVDKCNTPPCFEKIMDLFPLVKRRILVFSFFEEEDIRETIKIFNIVNKLFDFVIVTSDDTMTKTPFMCNRDFMKLLKRYGIPFKFIEDRREAIEYGVKLTNNSDGLFILGRGNESFMLIRGNRVKYSDVETVKEIIHGIKRN